MRNIFKNKKEEYEKEITKNETKITSEEKNKKETIFYGIVFGIILILSLITKFTSKDNENKNNNDNSTQSTNTIDNEDGLLKSLDNNNYDADLTIIADTDLLNLLIRKESQTKELIAKTYRDENQIFYINGDKIYKYSNNNFILDNSSNIYNRYDKTFMVMVNVNELIEKHTYEIDLKEEDYDIKRYKIEASRVIGIYNDYNKTDLNKRVSGEVILDIYYNEDTLKGMKLDLTNLYQNLNYDYIKVIYTYEFANFNKINIASLMEVPAE